MMGYGAVKMEAVQVRTNSTTTTNFKLSTQVIEGETIVVTVDAISVKRDQTSSIRNVSSDQIDMLPVESVQQVLNLQAGVVNGHFRGGRSNEVSYMMVDAHYGLTIGGGLKYILMRNMAIRIDYAYRDIGLLGKMHSYSLSVLY